MGRRVAAGWRLLYGLLGLLVPVLVPAQARRPAPGLRFDVQKGLPSNTVYDIYHASGGMLWFATDKGIARYDGSRFRQYTTYDGLPDNEIFFFQEDRQRRLWMATYSGALCYYQDGVFHTAQNTPFLRIPAPAAHIRYMVLQEDGSLTVMFAKTGRFLVVRGQHCRLYDAAAHCDIPGEELFDAVPLASGRLLLSTSRRRTVVDDRLRVLREVRFKRLPMLRFVPTHGRPFYVQDTTIMDRRFRLVSTLPSRPADLVRKVLPYRGRFVVGTAGELWVGDERFRANVSALCTDLFGRLWVGTLGGGAYCLDGASDAPLERPGLYTGAIRLATVVGDTLLLSTDAGLWYHVAVRTAAGGVRLDAGSPVRPAGPADPVEAITTTGEGGVLGATRIRLVRVSTGPGLRVRTLARLPEDEQAKELHVTGDRLYVRGAGGAMGYPKQLAIGDTSYGLTLGAPWERTYAAAVDRRGQYWLSTARGLYTFRGGRHPVAFDPETSFRWFLFAGDWQIGCTQGNLLTIRLPDARASIRRRAVWTGATRLDDAHLLLHTTDRYQLLSLLGGRHPAVVLQTLDDPYLPQQAEAIRVVNGVCCFLSDGQLTAVPVRRLLSPAREGARGRFTRAVTRSGGVAWDSGSRQLVLSYAAARRIELQYETVIPAGTRPAVEYAIGRDGPGEWLRAPEGHLDLVEPRSGRYEVRLRVATSGSGYGPEARFWLEIETPWWARAGVLAAAGLLLLTTLVLAVRLVVRSVLRRRERQHTAHIRLLQSEYNALNALMHPHFVFNSLNTIQALVHAGDPAVTSEYIGLFAKLLRQNLRNAKDGLITLEQELELVALYVRLEQLRFRTPVRYAVQVDEELDLDEILIPPLLIQPLVENALLHGLLPKAGGDYNIEVRLRTDAGRVRIDICDNGIGLTPAGTTAGTSIGLYAIQERLDRLNAVRGLGYEFRIESLRGDSDENRGTLATVFLPGA